MVGETASNIRVHRQRIYDKVSEEYGAHGKTGYEEPVGIATDKDAKIVH